MHLKGYGKVIILSIIDCNNASIIDLINIKLCFYCSINIIHYNCVINNIILYNAAIEYSNEEL